MVALLAVVLIAAVGLAIDVGRIMVAKAQLVRAVDAAALAGVLKLPSLDEATVQVNTYMAQNEPDATWDVPTSPGARQIEVHASKDVDLTFLSVLTIIPGIDLEDPVTVSAEATAGFGIRAVDTYLAIDATGSMGDSPCTATQTQSGCPIKEAKAAAVNFTNILLADAAGSCDPDGCTQVGVGAFRGCYNPPRSCLYDGSHSGCSSSGRDTCVVASQMLTNLSTNKSYVTSRVNGIWAIGHTSGTSPLQPDSGSGTNVCLAMYKGAWGTSFGLFGPSGQTTENTLKILVLLSDGDNNYYADAEYGNGQPPTECAPTDPSHSDSQLGSSCYSAQTHEKSLDIKTKALAATLKSQGVEIYVVGFGICGTNNPSQLPTTSYCSGIGNSDHDNTADRRLLKCIASSSAGTNDHYFEAATASQLPDIFSSIAREIAFRLIK
jgi:Flp pilus assembly protein TadG